jgi:hypothetical protein
MERYRVIVPRLNVRKAPVADFNDKSNILTTVSEGLELDLKEYQENPNPSLEKWYTDGKGQFYWGGGLQIVISEITKKGIYFDELNSEEQYQLAQDYIEEYLEELKETYPEITGMFVGKKTIYGKVSNLIAIGFQVSEKKNSTKQFPTIVVFKSYRIPTDVQEAGITVPHSVSIASGISKAKDLMYGTVGIPILKNGKLHYLSCYHVYCNEELAKGQYEVINKQNSINPTLISPCEAELNGNPRTIVGEVAEGFLTDFLDIAIMVPKISIIDSYTDFEGPIYYRTLTRENENNIFLQFKGNGSKNVKKSKLINIYINKFIDYKGKKKHLLKGLIQMEKCANDGDSGAAVCDLNGYYVGYIIGSDTNFTYAISAYTIINKTNYEFNTNN